MVKIRLARGGFKKRPFYSLVATDSRKGRDSGYIERLGFFNPMARGGDVRLRMNEERISYWLANGASFTERARSLWKTYRTELGEDVLEESLKKTPRPKVAKESPKVEAVVTPPKKNSSKKELPKKEQASAKKGEILISKDADVVEKKNEVTAKPTLTPVADASISEEKNPQDASTQTDSDKQ